MIMHRILLRFLAKISSFTSVLAEGDIFSPDILSQNYPCKHSGILLITYSHQNIQESLFYNLIRYILGI